jgi:hypothetical protein
MSVGTISALAAHCQSYLSQAIIGNTLLQLSSFTPSLWLHFYIYVQLRARICKSLRRPGIDSENSIPPAYVAWRAGTQIGLSYRPAMLGIDFWAP